MLPRLAWLLAGVTLALVVADVLVAAQAVSLTSETAVAVHGFPFVDGAVVGSAVMGALIVSRYERHPIGWLLALIGLVSAVSLVAEAYAYWVQEADGPGPAVLGSVSGWVSWLFSGQLAIAGIALLFLLAPDGHLVSRRWRYAAWVTGTGAALCLAAVLSMDPTTFRLETQSEDTDPVRSSLLSLGFLAISGGLVASVVSMVQRLRRSRGEQRQQVQLIALSAALVAVGIAFLLVVQLLNGGEQTWLAGVPLFVSYLLLPILLAVAVLRYRLYDVDVIINRTVVLVAGTAFAALGYTTLVVVVGDLVNRRTSGFWLSLLVTALVAIGFQPLRRRVVRLADRLAYGSRAQPYQELADFSRRLSDTPSPDALLSTVAAAAGQALAARRVTATLDVPGAGAIPAVWGAASSDGGIHAVTVRTGGVDLGSIEVVLPKGRRLRTVDRRLLEALADQAAIAFRNTTLELQLAGNVAELGRTTRELGRSRARIIEADDAVRRDLESAISRDVLPHLEAVDAGLRAIGDDSPAGLDARVDAMVDTVNAALESLRELTRGVFPTQLERSGLEPALRSLLARSAVAPTLSVDDSAAGRRFGPRVETAVYFCCSEAVLGEPGPTGVELLVAGDHLLVRIAGTPDGVHPQTGVDRLGAVGGTIRADTDGLTLRVPVGDPT